MPGGGGGQDVDASPVAKFQDRHTRWERLLHRLAFSTVEAHKGLAGLESRLFAERLRDVEIDRPVFIAALPRAGTTILLEILAALGPFATHTYRDMPFPLTPLLWNALSRRFRVPGAVVERAHGDGMTIGADSPEALDEVAWRAFWPEKYLDDRIEPWTAADRDAGREFASFFKAHVARIIALRSGAAGSPVRYLSKNNANLARIPRIAQLFPDAAVLVPFRNPLDHAASMLRQHRNFLRVHAREPFTRRYMADVGHYEFGANLRPIDFGGWLGAPSPGERAATAPANRPTNRPMNRQGRPEAHSARARTLDFWLRYWRAAYEHALVNTGGANTGGADAGGNVVFLSYDALCADPAPNLRRIGEALGIGEALDPAADRIRAPTRYPGEAGNADPRLLDAASALHRELLLRADSRAGPSSPF